MVCDGSAQREQTVTLMLWGQVPELCLLLGRGTEGLPSPTAGFRGRASQSSHTCERTSPRQGDAGRRVGSDACSHAPKAQPLQKNKIERRTTHCGTGQSCEIQT